MRTLALLLIAAPVLAQAPLSCPDAQQVKCVRDKGDNFRCSPGVYEPLPFGRVVEEGPSDATAVTDTRRIALKSLRFDKRGLNRKQQAYLLEEHQRRQHHGGRRTEIRTTDTRTREAKVEVLIPELAVRRFRTWVASGCQPLGQFLRYQPKAGRQGNAAKSLADRDRKFRDRLLGGSSPNKWSAGGEMDQRSRRIWRGQN